MFKSSFYADRRPAWFIALQALLILLELALVVFVFLHRSEITVERVVSYTPAEPLLAVLLILALFAFKSLAVVVYAGVIYAATGILFPLPLAILVNLLGTAVMSLIPYWFGRRAGADWMDRLRLRHPKLQAVEELRRGNGFALTLLLRVMDVLPYDIISAYLGAARIPFGPYMLGCLLGKLVTCVAFPVMGMNINRPGSPEFLTAFGLEVGLMLVSLLLTVILKKRKKDRENG